MTDPTCWVPTSGGQCVRPEPCWGTCHLDPAAQPAGPGAERSAWDQVRQLQQMFAASQADLTRVEQERDELVRQVESLSKSYGWLDGVAVNLRDSGDLARAELASARIELERLRAISASCHVTNCARCGRSIRCDEPREPVPSAAGYFQHAPRCPADSPPNPGGPREENP